MDSDERFYRFAVAWLRLGCLLLAIMVLLLAYATYKGNIRFVGFNPQPSNCEFHSK